MKKTVAMSLVAVVALNGSSIDEAFNSGKVTGQIRGAYVSQDNAADTDTYGTSIGGVLNYETGSWNDIKLGIGAYVSQKLPFATGDEDEGKANPDLFGENTSSYAYIGEAYLDYTANDFNLRVGRQLIDTPLADTDDIRMHPNTFEAAIGSYSGFEGTTVVGGYITRWAGYDSGDDISKFKKLGSDTSNGAAVLGIVNESVENLAVQGWYYGIDELADAFYTDALYVIPFSETMKLELAGQFTDFNEKKNSGMDGSVYGIVATYNFGMFILSAAYNKVSNDEGKIISNGFGGGAYFTSMEEITIDNLEDAKAYQLSAEFDLANVGIEGLTLSTLYGDFKSRPMDANVKEFDIIAAYKMSEAVSADISYATVNDKNNNFNGGDDGGYDRFLARIQYSF
jgi:imipenem/basic amino acid-specific outer membrane pore